MDELFFGTSSIAWLGCYHCYFYMANIITFTVEKYSNDSTSTRNHNSAMKSTIKQTIKLLPHGKWDYHFVITPPQQHKWTINNVRKCTNIFDGWTYERCWVIFMISWRFFIWERWESHYGRVITIGCFCLTMTVELYS